jgi:hypothetical protein
VTLTGGNLSNPLTNRVAINYDNVLPLDANTHRVQLAIDPATGLITGYFVDPNNSATNAIYGTVLQSFGEARGFFLSVNASGSFSLGEAMEER